MGIPVLMFSERGLIEVAKCGFMFYPCYWSQILVRQNLGSLTASGVEL